MKSIFVLLLLVASSCSFNQLKLQSQPGDEISLVTEYDGTDIWAESFVNPGKVSDLDFDQNRQLPSRRAGKLVFPDGKTFLHIATVKSHVYQGSKVIGYWMEADTLVYITTPLYDTVLHLNPCRFYAGLDSYPSNAYKMWHQDGMLVMPEYWITNPLSRIPVYPVGATLTVRADISSDESEVSFWWINEP